MRRDRGATGPLVFLAIVLMVLLPVLYLLSAGPATWLYSRGCISSEAVEFFYTPLAWVCEHCKPLQDFIVWYDSLFRPDLPVIPE